MKLLVCGSRSITDREYVYSCIDDANQLLGVPIRQIIEGDAKGVDQIAGEYAISHQIGWCKYLPNWGKFGKSAGFKRNTDMVIACDKGIAIWDGISKGTKDSIIKLKKSGKLLKIYRR